MTHPHFYHSTSNNAENSNSVLRMARELPLSMLNLFIYRMSVRRWAQRHAEAQDFTTLLVPAAHTQLLCEQALAREYDVGSTNVANNYVVTHRATGKTRNIIMVLLDPKASFCACLYPYRGGLPCRHLIRLAHSLQIIPSTLAAYHHTTAAYKEAYSYGLIAIETPEEGWAMDDLLPPPMKVMPGRPRVRRFTNNMDAPGAAPRAKRKCKRCLQLGHMEKTCQSRPPNSDD